VVVRVLAMHGGEGGWTAGFAAAAAA
jgi:hypothetical protein